MTHLEKQCVNCKKHTLSISHNLISCSSCDFKVKFNCPLCNTSLDTASVSDDTISCHNCHGKIPISKIKFLIENDMVIDLETRCEFCNGPSIHKSSMNIGHRCFYFPKCSGQASLFGNQQENLVFLDFETSGLEIGKDEIIEIGALKIDEEGNEIPYQQLIKPKASIGKRITEITGISDAMVTDAPSIEEPMKKLIDFIGNCKIVAHNAEFDILWLITTCKKLSIPFTNNDIVCTYKWAKSIGEKSCSLGALSKKYNISHQNAHRALADVAATKELFFIFESKKVPYNAIKMDSYYKQADKLLENYRQISINLR